MKMFLLFFSAFAYVSVVAATLQDEKGTSVGQRKGSAIAGVEILTPTGSVDFTDYIKSLHASVRKNWLALMPKSVEAGEKGKVVLRFQILPQGKLQEKDLIVESATGSEELRRASIAAIKASSPFEPLPKAFEGPYIEVRFTFLYNLPAPARP
jgi:TonB family protein